MKIINCHVCPDFKQIDSIEKTAELLNTGHTQIIHMRLQPGDYIAEHKTPIDVTFFVYGGDLEMKIGNEIQIIKSGSSVWSPRQIPHSFINKSESVSNVLVIKHKNS